ncbi:cytochrome d ubiquinol oxidase subunit I [Catenuloplanes nepalensis]|uniref:Cytochrome d ubiquinol oxidase subunit I n=1 Tax=Catenuloplanes nepalensis TaxID=587533 RepID=A0ABT9N2A2_9ACTN|nr:cytochrome ubiquinol oxidase subunit I [Catenuloplanes nepalensis]MDP9797824.1 cytochrome d ubiquinol oxidase subunit I [Catenuloplanes nepalensis]
MDTVEWARVQFGVTAGAHFLFVLVTLGLVTLLVAIEATWVITKRPGALRALRFWGTLYVTNYVVGIAGGIVMEFQFGLNWSGVSRVAGNVIGAPLAIETLVAFVLESTLLGLWIAGWHRIRPWAHLLLLCGVALTAYLSVFWIMVANAYLQNPVGHEIRPDGTAVLADPGPLLTNPALTLALVHVAGAALACGGFLMAGISAWHLLRHRTADDRALAFRPTARLGLLTGLAGLYLSFNSGWAQLGPVGAVQPTKFGEEAEKLAAATGFAARFGGQPADYLPPEWITIPYEVMQFTAFGLGIFVYLLPLLFRNWLLRWRWSLTLLVCAAPLPFVAAICGWLLREVGRAPFAIYGMLPAADAMTPRSPALAAASCLLFAVLVIGLGVLNWTLLLRVAGRGSNDPPLGRLDDPAAEPATKVLV